MTIDRDPTLQNLFDVAKQDLAGDAFVAQLMSRIDSLRRRSIIGWIFVALVAVPCAWFLTAPLTDAVYLTTQILPESLIEVDDRWLAQLLSPVNSIAGLVALGFLGLRMAYRTIFS